MSFFSRWFRTSVTRRRQNDLIQQAQILVVQNSETLYKGVSKNIFREGGLDKLLRTYNYRTDK